MLAESFLEDALLQFRKLKSQADRAIAQVEPPRWFAAPDPESNSLALLTKHLSGNMRSRWRDFLASDGEKPDRDRDSEFVVGKDDTPERLRDRWEAGWALVFASVGALKPEDLEKIVRVRGEPHTVLQAINRQLTHYAGHVGQIVYLAKHLAGPRWRTLSIPRGKSRDYEVAKDGSGYLPDTGTARP
jgi:hypothetical protein